MGCDIHLYTEVKINGKWFSYNKADVDRDYDLFFFMAGVRGRDNDTETLAAPKGLPNDASEVVRMEYFEWAGDAHSASWFNAKEIKLLDEFVQKKITENVKSYPKALYDYPEKRWGYLSGNSYGSFVDNPEDYCEEIQDIRFVFWFDN